MEPMARATNVFPSSAKLVYSFNLLKNRRAFWLLQIPATICFFLFGSLFIGWMIWIRPGLVQTISASVDVNPLYAVILIISFMVAILLHEQIHGVFFWLYSHSRPRFGLRGGYAYAAAPGWFFPREQYLVIALAPFVLLSILGMLLMVVVPVGALAAIFFGTITNAAGAVGDMWIAIKVIRDRRNIVVEDLGDGINIYALG